MTKRKSLPEQQHDPATSGPVLPELPADAYDADAVDLPPADFDAEAVARAQIAEHIGPHRVDHRRLEMAVHRHIQAVEVAGEQVPLDWATRYVLRDGGAP